MIKEAKAEELVLYNLTRIPVSRERKAAVKEAYLAYWNKVDAG